MKKRSLFGIILALAHLYLVIYTINSILYNREPDWPMYWMLFTGIDFPFSLFLLPLSFLLDFLNLGVLVETFPSPLNDVTNFWLPAFFFGILGTIWFFFIPTIVMKIVSWRTSRVK